MNRPYDFLPEVDSQYERLHHILFCTKLITSKAIVSYRIKLDKEWRIWYNQSKFLGEGYVCKKMQGQPIEIRNGEEIYDL